MANISCCSLSSAAENFHNTTNNYHVQVSMNQVALYQNISQTSANKSLEVESFCKRSSFFCILDICFDKIFGWCFVLFGVVNNIINIIIFRLLGLKNNTGVGLIVVSVTDFMFCLMAMIDKGIVTYLMYFSITESDYIEQFDYLLNARDILYNCSCWINAFLSLERCVCVMNPFRVKIIFTRFRWYFIMVAIYVINIATRMIHIFVQDWEFTNDMKMMEIKYQHGTTLVLSIIIGYFLPMLYHLVLVLSSFIMIYGLIKSSRIRSHMTAKHVKNQPRIASTISAKERRLVKVVLLLTLVIVVCNCPLFAKWTYAIHSGNEGKVNAIISMMVTNFGIMNCSFNFIIYITVNTSYRRKCEETLNCRKYLTNRP